MQNHRVGPHDCREDQGEEEIGFVGVGLHIEGSLRLDRRRLSFQRAWQQSIVGPDILFDTQYSLN